MKKTKLLLMSAFAALALTACGGSKPGKDPKVDPSGQTTQPAGPTGQPTEPGTPSGQPTEPVDPSKDPTGQQSSPVAPTSEPESSEPVVLPSGAEEADISTDEGKQAVAKSIDKIIANVRGEEKLSFKGVQAEAYGEIRDTNLKVDKVNIAVEGEDGNISEPTELPFNLDANIEKFGGELLLTYARISDETTDHGYCPAGSSISLRNANVAASVKGNLPNLLEMIVNGNMIGGFLDAKDVDLNLNVDPFDADVYFADQEDQLGLYANISDRSVSTALSQLTTFIGQVIDTFESEETKGQYDKFRVDLNQLLDSILPSRKVYTIFENTRMMLPVDGYSYSPLNALPEEYDGEAIVALFGLVEKIGLGDAIKVGLYEDGGIGLAINLNASALGIILNLVASLTEASDMVTETIIPMILEAVKNFSLGISAVIDGNGLVTSLEQSLDFGLDYTLANLPVEIQIGEGEAKTLYLGADLKAELHEQLSIGVEYGDFSVAYPDDLETYEYFEIPGQGEVKPEEDTGPLYLENEQQITADEIVRFTNSLSESPYESLFLQIVTVNRGTDQDSRSYSENNLHLSEGKWYYEDGEEYELPTMSSSVPKLINGAAPQGVEEELSFFRGEGGYRAEYTQYRASDSLYAVESITWDIYGNPLNLYIAMEYTQSNSLTAMCYTFSYQQSNNTI